MQAELMKVTLQVMFRNPGFIETNFGSHKSEREMFSAMWNHKWFHHILAPEQVISRKSDVEAERLREEGNQRYRQKDYPAALELYCRSIRAATHPPIPGDGTASSVDQDELYTSLARGYGNRSAVLFIMEEYPKCIQDIELALALDNSCTFRKKLLDRKEKCITAIEISGKDWPGLKPLSPPVLQSCNPNMPFLSSSIKHVYTPSEGHQLVAVKDISPGELISVEKREFLTVKPEMLSVHCSTCGDPCNAPLPCPSCCLVVFCSIECRDQGLHDFHSVECSILPSLLPLDLFSGQRVATRMLIRGGYAALEYLQPQSTKSKRAKEQQKTEQFPLAAYYKHIDTLPNAKYHTLNPMELFEKGCFAFMILKLLQVSSTFTFVDGKRVTPSQQVLISIGSALLRISLLPITQTHFKMGAPWSKAPSVFYGANLPLFRSLSTCACNPSAIDISCGRYKIVRAVCSIPSGGQVTLSNGYLYFHSSLFERKMRTVQRSRELRMMDTPMSCECRACVEGWPTLDQMDGSIQLRCVSCASPLDTLGRCQTCHLPHSGKDGSGTYCFGNIQNQIRQALEKFRSRENAIENGEDSDQDREMLQQVVELLDKYAMLPCKPHAEAQILLSNCWHKRDNQVEMFKYKD